MSLFGSSSAKASRAVICGPKRLRIGAKHAALGLLWQPAQQQLPLREQARIASGPHGRFDLCASFANRKQFGFASTGEGQISGMLAGASLVGDEWGANWLAAFEISGEPRSWWVVAMRNGLIYDDQLHRTSNDAREAFLKSLEAPDWEFIAAPKAWAIENTNVASLDDAISFSNAVKLRPVNLWPRIAIGLAAALTAVLACYFGWSEYSKFREQERTALKSLKPVPEIVQVFPWKDAPDIRSFVLLCAEEMNRLTIAVPGWSLQSAECVSQGMLAEAQARWQRKRGRISWLKAATHELAGTAARVLKGGERAEIRSVFPLAAGPAAQSSLPTSAADLETALRDRFLSLDLNLQISTRNGTPRINGNPGISGFGFHDLSIATSAGVGEYARLLADIPALVPQSLIFNFSTNSWLLKARAFHSADAIGGNTIQ